MQLPATLTDFAERAAAMLGSGPHGYVDGGSGDETTLRANVTAWRRIGLRQRVLVDVSRPDLSVHLLGVARPHPLVLAPMAFQRMVHPDGEIGLAAGAASTGTPYCLSTLATTGIRELADAVPQAVRWFQLYVFRDRGLSRAMVAEAADAGYEAVVITVDLPLPARRDRDLRTAYALPAATTVPSARAAGAPQGLRPEQFAGLVDPSLRWDDLAEFVRDSPLPVLVKGVLDPVDAALAVDAGVAAIIVSNHGGRQLDRCLPTAAALPDVLDVVAGRVDVLVDGGVRRGNDVLTALAMGAAGVLVGRPASWGLTVGGAAGVGRVLEILLAEFAIALSLVGVPNARDLDRSVLLPAAW